MKSLKEILQESGDLYPDVTPKGWECPKCGRVYSPTTPMCFYCGGEQTVTATSVTGGTKTGDVEEPRYCDRNICMTNEYNGIECDECEVTKHNERIKKCESCYIAQNYNLEDDDSPCMNCGVE